MKKIYRPMITFFIHSLLILPSFASDMNPVGQWTTIDDESNQPKSIIEIYESDGTLQGKVLEILPGANTDLDPKCDKCKGEKKDQPVKGMVILWGMKKTTESTWEKGEIMDPKNGKTYSCKLTLKADGSRLEVRGFLGFSLLGRTQTWLRRQKEKNPEIRN